MKRARRVRCGPSPEIDREAAAVEADFAGVDLDRLERVEIDLDPRLVEHIRSRSLKQITLRVGEEQVAEARREARATGTKYQAVLRRWLAQSASAARMRRLKRHG